MLSILVLLLNRDRVTAKELAEKFEVNIRTVYRDIDAINLAGIPIISYQGNNGGFGLISNYRLDRHYLSVTDMKKIVTALKSFNSTLDDTTIENIINKIEHLVPSGSEYEISPESVIVDILPWGIHNRVKEYLKIFNKAITDKKLINISYSSLRSTETERIIEPVTLVLKGTSWYIFAYCRCRCDYRLFKIARIKKLTVTDEHFTRRVMSYYDYHNNFEHDNINYIELVLKFPLTQKPLLDEYFPDSDINKKEDHYIVNTKIPDDYWVLSWIISMGDTVEIIEPLNLRLKVIETAENILKKYQT